MKQEGVSNTDANELTIVHVINIIAIYDITTPRFIKHFQKRGKRLASFSMKFLNLSVLHIISGKLISNPWLFNFSFNPNANIQITMKLSNNNKYHSLNDHLIYQVSESKKTTSTISPYILHHFHLL